MLIIEKCKNTEYKEAKKNPHIIHYPTDQQ